MPEQPFPARVARWLMAHVNVPMVLLALICLGMVVPAARAKPFWHDEIYTVLLSRLPSVGAIWRAALEGVDLSPPLNLWVTRGVHALIGVGHLQTRVPALLGFSLTVFLIFLVLLRRAGAPAAIAGALLLFLTAGLRYAVEARAYGLMMGLSAAAIYTWMEAAQGRRRAVHLPLLAMALAGSIWNHYFGVLAFVPIVAGECVRTLHRRRIDPGVAFAVVTAIVAAVPIYPLLRAASDQRSTFWSMGAGAQVTDVYAFLLNALLAPAFLLLAGVLVLALALAPLLRRRIPGDIRRVPMHEAVAIAAAAAVPVLAVLLGRFVTGVFVPRYALGGLVGLCMAVPLALWRWNVRRLPVELLLCGALLWVVGTSAIASVRAIREPPDPLAAHPLLLRSAFEPGPTVVSSRLQFLQYWYYLPADLKGRVVYLADPGEALKRTGSDTIDRGYLALARWTPVPVEGYETFTSRHTSFRVYEAGSGWLLARLTESGARIEPIGTGPAGRLFQVTMAPR